MAVPSKTSSKKSDGITEKKLLQLAESLGNHDDLLKLALTLDFTYEKWQMYKASNTGASFCHGTFKMLYDWKKKTPKNLQMTELNNALIEAKFVELAEEYFGNLTIEGPSHLSGARAKVEKNDSSSQTDGDPDEQKDIRPEYGTSHLSGGRGNVKIHDSSSQTETSLLTGARANVEKHDFSSQTDGDPHKQKNIPAEYVVLVTGAADYLGSHIVKMLLEVGYCVRGVVTEKSCSMGEYYHARNLEVIRIDDLTDAAEWARVVRGCTHVIHTAGIFPEDSRMQTQSGVKLLLQTCKINGVQRVIVTGTCNFIDGIKAKSFTITDEALKKFHSTHILQDVYSKMKTEQEVEHIQRSRDPDLNIITIRSSIAMGPSMIPTAREEFGLEIVRKYVGGNIPDFAINCNFPMCDVRDIARAHVAALEKQKPFNMYESVEPQNVSLEDVQEFIRQMSDCSDHFCKTTFYNASWIVEQFVNDSTSKAILLLYGRHASYRRQLPITYLVERQFDVKQTVTDTARQLTHAFSAI